jgi:CRP-like cAMP-binding protein
MSVDDDVALFERIPSLRLLGDAALRMLALASEQHVFQRGDILFYEGEEADAGFVVKRGAIRVEDNTGAGTIAGPGVLIGELAMVAPIRRPATATALEHSSVVRIPRGLIRRVLDADPAAAGRLRDEFAARSSRIAEDLQAARAKLNA